MANTSRMRALAKHLVQKETIKDAFAGMGFFTATSALVQLCLPIIREKNIFAKLVFLAIIYGLLVLSASYFVVHVIRPFVKIFYPNFTLPYIDDRHLKKKARSGAFLFALLCFITLYLGWTLVEIALLSLAKKAG